VAWRIASGGRARVLAFIELEFYSVLMTETSSDGILVARITGTASRHSRHRPLTEAEHHAAVTELADIAAGRSDLLAQCAGIAAGCHDGALDEARYLQVAQLCVDAGADASQIPRWTQEGHRRAAAARASRVPR
jgi:hypothetical protein